MSGGLAKFVDLEAFVGQNGFEVKESIRKTFDLGQPSAPFSLKQELVLLFRLFCKSNPTTKSGGYDFPYYKAIFTGSRKPLWMLGQVLAQAKDDWLPDTEPCKFTSFPVMLPSLKLTQQEKKNIDSILKQSSKFSKEDLPIASGNELEIDADGNTIYPWQKYLDHEDDLVKIEIYEREHKACIDHIL